jgi:hypothetical protein
MTVTGAVLSLGGESFPMAEAESLVSEAARMLAAHPRRAVDIVAGQVRHIELPPAQVDAGAPCDTSRWRGAAERKWPMPADRERGVGVEVRVYFVGAPGCDFPGSDFGWPHDRVFTDGGGVAFVRSPADMASVVNAVGGAIGLRPSRTLDCAVLDGTAVVMRPKCDAARSLGLDPFDAMGKAPRLSATNMMLAGLVTMDARTLVTSPGSYELAAAEPGATGALALTVPLSSDPRVGYALELAPGAATLLLRIATLEKTCLVVGGFVGLKRQRFVDDVLGVEFTVESLSVDRATISFSRVPHRDLAAAVIEGSRCIDAGMSQWG